MSERMAWLAIGALLAIVSLSLIGFAFAHETTAPTAAGENGSGGMAGMHASMMNDPAHRAMHVQHARSGEMPEECAGMMQGDLSSNDLQSMHERMHGTNRIGGMH